MTIVNFDDLIGPQGYSNCVMVVRVPHTARCACTGKARTTWYCEREVFLTRGLWWVLARPRCVLWWGGWSGRVREAASNLSAYTHLTFVHKSTAEDMACHLRSLPHFDDTDFWQRFYEICAYDSSYTKYWEIKDLRRLLERYIPPCAQCGQPIAQWHPIWEEREDAGHYCSPFCHSTYCPTGANYGKEDDQGWRRRSLMSTGPYCSWTCYEAFEKEMKWVRTGGKLLRQTRAIVKTLTESQEVSTSRRRASGRVTTSRT